MIVPSRGGILARIHESDGIEVDRGIFETRNKGYEGNNRGGRYTLPFHLLVLFTFSLPFTSVTNHSIWISLYAKLNIPVGTSCPRRTSRWGCASCEAVHVLSKQVRDVDLRINEVSRWRK